ncbi:hypothetical protein F5X68DRAFT_238766 [Plectosphaerella plurivora]|uniref:Uncharacterized protein n=1 Tax=Plectosphaerella plurivora TaxID=936078 RepID=A0A9P9AGK7_9PEZI|nr:hypothetical protein F5X68DRAFT_238766 [Plectosphaerella plurivora]
MAQLLAPYNNSMRLGQGFNSYIQQICLDRAVLEDKSANRKRLDEIIRKDGLRPTQVPGDAGKETASAFVESAHSEPDVVTNPNSEQGTSEENKERYAESEDKDNGSPEAQRRMIVTYSSRFVDKLSDVTEAMNISGSLSIKTGTIGGAANGSYVDSDKFKASDINFHLQVKVTNQVQDAGKNYTIFNKIEDVTPEKFPQVYGDTFISGWEEGGELNAIISMKVSDKSKITEIKAGLEASMTTPAGVSIDVKGHFEMDKRNITRDTETTIAVNWSGGGSVKKPGDYWSIATLKQTAAAFPDLVAITPQRTYAILTRYTALESFQLQNRTYKPLDYENAGIYTGALLDNYMDYKVLWKQISQATYELEARRATIEMATPSEEMVKLAEVKIRATEDDVNLLTGQDTIAEKEVGISSVQSSTATVQGQQKGGGGGPINEAGNVTKADLAVTRQTHHGTPTAADTFKYEIFHDSFAGLIEARKVCRFEMSKIVKEVEKIAKHPKLASDPGRDAFFLNPLVFRQLLPVMRVAPEDGACYGEKNNNGALILGYSRPDDEDEDARRAANPAYKLDEPLEVHHTRLRQTLLNVGRKARDYRMQGFAGEIKNPHAKATLQNDLKQLDPSFRPTKLSVWFSEGIVSSVQVQYANGTTVGHEASVHLEPPPKNQKEAPKARPEKGLDGEKGAAEATVTPAEPPAAPPAEASTAQQAAPGEAKDPQSDGKKKPTPPPAISVESPRVFTDPKTSTWSRPDHDNPWSLRGFITVVSNDNTLQTLGIIWGKEPFAPMPVVRASPPLCKDFLALSHALRENIDDNSQPGVNGSFPGRLLMGHSVSTGAARDSKPGESKLGGPKPFNALDDIDFPSLIGFAAVEGQLTGIKVSYFTGEELTHGTYKEGPEVWECLVRRVKDAKGGHVSAIEFIRAEKGGQLPQWSLDVATLRYVPEQSKGGFVDRGSIVELAPVVGNANWSVRGFYGEVTDGVISRLGVIWGRG